MADKSLLVTIRFESQIQTAQNSLVRYIQEYLTRASSHVVTRNNDDGVVEIVGYEEVDNSGLLPVRPQYRTSCTRLPGEIDWLRENCRLIRKLVRKDVITSNVGGGYGMMKTLYSWLGVPNPTPPEKNRIPLRYELGCNINESEFDKIAEIAAGETDSGKNVGFVLKNDSEVHWLSHAFVKQKLEIPISFSESKIPSAKDMLRALTRKKSHITSVLPE